MAIIKSNPSLYVLNVHRAFKYFFVTAYDESNPMQWHSDWVYPFYWRITDIFYDDITDFVLHGRQLIEPLSRQLGIIIVNSWLFFLIPVGIIAYACILFVQNRLNLKRWRHYFKDNATLVLLTLYAVYGMVVYNFFELGENDRFRAELEPFYFVFIVAFFYHYLWKSRYRLRYGIFFGLLLIGWTGFSMLMDYPYLYKPAYTAPIQAEGVADGHVFGDVLQLTWREPIVSDHETLVEIPLSWEILRPTDEIYSATIQLLDANQNRITGIDMVLGSAQAPFIPTSRWHVGKILREWVILDLPADAPPIADVMVNVFIDRDWQNSLVYTLPDGTPTGDKFLRLQSFGILGEGIYAPADMPPATFRLGDVSVAVVGMDYADGVISIAGVMNANRTLTQDYILFFHVVDVDGNIIQQSDNVYLADKWTTSALIPNRPFAFRREIILPDGADADYEVKFGAYTLPSGVRITLYDGNGTRLADDMGEWGVIDG
jgi:hypothetical protein